MCVCVCIQTQWTTTQPFKKTKIILFAATWMDLEIIILSKVSQRQTSCDIIYMQNLKYDTNELIYETETDSQTQKTYFWLPKGKGRVG